MEKLQHQFIGYLSKMTGLPVSWGEAVSRPLPQYLVQRYVLREIRIGGRVFLGILLRDAQDFRPAGFEKHLGQILPKDAPFEGFCLIASHLPGYTRRRLVERHIPFVAPGQQLHWPALGVAAQARKTGRTPSPTTAVTPATQAVLIYALNGNIKKPVTPKELANKLGYTPMSMTRALDEIEANDLGKLTRQGRERCLDFSEPPKDLWQKALPYLRTPVRETIHIKEATLPLNMRIKAGESALADLSMLAPPREPIFALGRRDWKHLTGKVEQIPVEDAGTCRIQLWRYNPALFIQNSRVDHFSLYLSLQDETDERIEMALEEMMEKIL
ncbi:MAG: transcriptional regulator [Desulfobacteraceae bacterium]|nr:MAG: transcriptional regulator [Desulfobacteraceae bacterium]